MKYFNLALAAVFILFAYWQLNDPDWPQWVAMYGLVATVATGAAFGWRPRWLAGLGFSLAILGLFMLVPDFIQWLRLGAPTIAGQMKAESPTLN
ncbi:MAG: hypothetical protein HC821_00840 [Lewinella sp.]|nr:hypothetical protein [Lewinella sp.]